MIFINTEECIDLYKRVITLSPGHSFLYWDTLLCRDRKSLDLNTIGECNVLIITPSIDGRALEARKIQPVNYNENRPFALNFACSQQDDDYKLARIINAELDRFCQFTTCQFHILPAGSPGGTGHGNVTGMRSLVSIRLWRDTNLTRLQIEPSKVILV